MEHCCRAAASRPLFYDLERRARCLNAAQPNAASVAGLGSNMDLLVLVKQAPLGVMRSVVDLWADVTNIHQHPRRRFT
jgi:hypothetical protein